MSRSCMYCGRELEKGERCNCPVSIRMRNEKQSNQNNQDNNSNQSQQSTQSYSSYTPPRKEKTKREWRKENREKRRKERPVRNKTYKKSAVGVREFFSYIAGCIQAPIFKASNPEYIGMGQSMLLVGLQGFVVSSALFLSTSAMKKGLFGILSLALGFKGVAGWKNLLQLLISAISGTALGFMQYFLMCAIFFLIGKFAVRSTSRYRDYVEKFVPCTVPLTVLGLLGVIFAVFSPSTLMIMLICGLVLEVILIYESLRSHWHTKPDFTVYTIVGGLFIYSVLFYNLYKILIS